MLWRWSAAVPAPCAGVALRTSLDRAGSLSQALRQNHLTVVGWIDVVRSGSSSTSHRGRSAGVRTPSRRGALLSMEIRAGEELESHRVGAATERPVGRPLTSAGPCELRGYRRCRSPPADGPVAGGAVATAHRWWWCANGATVAASAGREPGSGAEGSSSPGHGPRAPAATSRPDRVIRSRVPGARSGVRHATPAGGWPARRGCRRARPRRERHSARRCS